VHAVIAHSFGVACLSASLNAGFQCPAAIALSSPPGFQSLIDGYARFLRMPAMVKNRLAARIFSRIGGAFRENVVPTCTPAQLPRHCLVVHDTDDKTVPWEVGEELARCWPNAEFLLTEGLGHRRLLLSGKLARHISAYLDKIPRSEPD
jgi:hypothetical protein